MNEQRFSATYLRKAFRISTALPIPQLTNSSSPNHSSHSLKHSAASHSYSWLVRALRGNPPNILFMLDFSLFPKTQRPTQSIYSFTWPRRAAGMRKPTKQLMNHGWGIPSPYCFVKGLVGCAFVWWATPATNIFGPCVIDLFTTLNSPNFHHII